jgi:hypothetical protein
LDAIKTKNFVKQCLCLCHPRLNFLTPKIYKAEINIFVIPRLCRGLA